MSETLQKEVISPGNGIDKPKAGDVVTMDYTGWLYEKNQPENRGKLFDSSQERGEFNTKIGVKKVIQGTYFHLP
ncbi:hypothetical protein EPUS_02324 [Endocarpon pusillum Z07020]|uniref:peptidylprolyl isomerase n=1 Tax=Endocarpon pusillum (strain Z07020 / HMAS-L-300199) TaxID=1263415 RepID=U1I0P5_ENDPU|nr:uncharacterized protein EPUS_02324 [Endocarpon pusillum Z07020]ERF76785.1 hypothetical protein EPUS_02324 [Endocarpon pusillum Z07020]